MQLKLLALILLVALSACGEDPVPSPDTGARVDRRRPGPRPDSGIRLDAGAASPDADTPDAGSPDADAPDADAPDADTPDADAPDADAPDAGSPDADAPDADAPDAAAPDAAAPDVGFPDATAPDLGTLDAGHLDSGAPDIGAPDATVFPDATVIPDATVVPDAGTAPVTAGLAITEILTSTSGYEYLEITNLSTAAVDLASYTLSIASHLGGVALPIRAASDPSGAQGLPVTLGAGLIAWGVANPTSAAAVPAGAFVFGAPGALSAGAFDDAGDSVRLEGPSGLADEVNFTMSVTSSSARVTAGVFPLLYGVPIQVDVDVPPASLTTLNDQGDVWCAPVHRGGTRGRRNLDCDWFVINELLYDYDSLSSGSDTGREFIEIIGAAGGSLDSVRLVHVQGAAASAGAVLWDVALNADRMPADGIYVLANNDSSGVTLVDNADQRHSGTLQNGPDAVQLVLDGATPVLLDAVGYGALPAGLIDNARSLAAFEGTPTPDPAPGIHSITFARVDAVDTGDNLADLHLDPSATPGRVNGRSVFTVDRLDPDDAIAAGTATITMTGFDFTDRMTVSVGGAAVPQTQCAFLAANTLRCLVAYPASGPGTPERVQLTVATRPEHGQSVERTFTWTNTANGTGNSNECDFCNLQFPTMVRVATGTTTPLLFGRIFEAGLTDVTAGDTGLIVAEVGFGPAGDDPRVSNGWRWSPMVFNVEYGNDDEYFGTLVAPAPGTYTFTTRFSLDGGLTWTYTDLDGAGSNPGLQLTVASMGTLVVVP